MSPGQEVVQRTPQQELVARIASPEFRQEIAFMLPEAMSPDRFLRVVRTAVLNNSDLATKGDPNTVLREALKAAQDGLLPDGREAAFVLFGIQCVYLPMIAGFRKIAAEHGWSLRTGVIYEADEFEYIPTEEKIRHVPVRPGRERGTLIGAYAFAVHRDGRREPPVVLDREDIEKVRAKSRAKDSGPWADWYEQMAEKTAGRRAFKKLPLAERDLIERVLSREPAEASVQMYGPNGGDVFVNRETGEITSGADTSNPTDVGGHPAVSPDDQEAEGAGSSAAVDAPPQAPSAPDPDDEPVLAEADFGVTAIPTGTNKGKTLAEVGENAKGWEWLAWATKDERPWNREGDRNAAFGEAVRAYVAKNTEQSQES